MKKKFSIILTAIFLAGVCFTSYSIWTKYRARKAEEYYNIARCIAITHTIEYRSTVAKKFLNKALRINPNYKEARELLANIYRWESRKTDNKVELEKSITLLRSQLKATPEDPDTHYLLALSYSDKGLYNKALFHLDRALNLCGTEPKRLSRRICCHNAIAHIYKEERQYMKAISEYEKVINLDPNNGWAYFNIGKVHHENLKDFDEAQEWYNKALEKMLGPARKRVEGKLVELGFKKR